MSDKVIPVKVAVRCRPLVDKERNEGCQTCVSFVPGESQIIIGKDKAFTFDFVFDPACEQRVVYSNAVLPLINGLFKGYNATVLAYGQTGSGKTFSMGGGYGISLETEEEATGVIPRVIRDLFDGINERESDFEFTVKVSYLEIYKEDIMDLLVPIQKRDKDQVTVREDNAGIKLVGLTELEVKSYKETMQQLESGSNSRTTGATAMNNQSSRSHAIFTLYIDRKSRSDSQDFCKAKFHLVDLAGSERIKKTHAEGERLKEGININKGLLVLGNVISALGEEASGSRGHIPYRDSKLTRLLQDSLGGNSHTVMIACISPADSNIEETINTLRYADRARKIKNKPVINRDPNVAEILRLRQLVQDLQRATSLRALPSADIAGTVASISGTMNSSNAEYKQLMERNKKLEDDNSKLSRELEMALGENAEIMEKMVVSDLSRDRLMQKIQELKEKAGKSINLLSTTMLQTQDGEMQTSTMEQLNSADGAAPGTVVAGSAAAAVADQLSMMREFQQKITELECEDETSLDDTSAVLGLSNTPTNAGILGEDASLLGSAVGGPEEEELRSKHVLRQARLGRELQELNKLLSKKQELAGQMKMSDEQLQAMRAQYEGQMKDMEGSIEALQKEKEELTQALTSAKTTVNNNKVSEQRRKRLQELEAQIGQYKKKMQEQSRMLKIKEQADKQVEQLNQEILRMKQQRVKLMNQIKDDAEQFRKLKQQMSKEVLQLKSQDRKRVAEIAKLQQQHSNQQVVLRRKAEEAAAANNRLKEVLLRQKSTADDRAKKQENADVSSIGVRVRKIMNEEIDFLVSVESAKLHLNNQLGLRKEMTEQIQQIKKRLDRGEGPLAAKRAMLDSSAECTDDDKISLKEQLKEFEQQVNLCNAQITDLQQKLIDADQDEKTKSRFTNIHSIIEAKCAMKHLLTMLVASRVECDKKNSEMEDMRDGYEENMKNSENQEEEWTAERQKFEQELYTLRKEQESKVLYLLNQLRSNGSQMSSNQATVDKELRTRLEFQEKEIARLACMEEEYNEKVKECDYLRKQLTKAQYMSVCNLGSGAGGVSLLPSCTDMDSSKILQDSTNCPSANNNDRPAARFFSPAFLSKQTRRKTFGVATGKLEKNSKKNKQEDDIMSEESDGDYDDDNEDPDWHSGQTPRVARLKLIDGDTTESSGGSTTGAGCSCKTDCSTRRCACSRSNGVCGTACRCKINQCLNRPTGGSTGPSSANSSHNEIKSETESIINRTFTQDKSSDAGDSDLPEVKDKVLPSSRMGRKSSRSKLGNSAAGKETVGQPAAVIVRKRSSDDDEMDNGQGEQQQHEKKGLENIVPRRSAEQERAEENTLLEEAGIGAVKKRKLQSNKGGQYFAEPVA